MKKKIVSLILTAALALGVMPLAVFAEDDYATRGEVCDMLLAAADDYNSGVEKTDILKGYEDGQLHEEQSVTRAEALVMLKRAFGEIPEIKGSNKYIAFPAETFTDIPDWAKTELSDVFDAGIVAGKSEGIFAPDDNVTTDEMKLFIERMYRVFGTNLKDNYYQTVNSDPLNNTVMPEGQSSTGTIRNDTVDIQIRDLVKEIASSNPDKNSKSGKIKTLYDNYMNKEARNEQGYEPLKPYLDEIDAAKSVADLVDTYAINSIMGFTVTNDYIDSNSYINMFYTPSILTKDMYEGKAESQKAAMLDYISDVFVLIGYSEADAEAAADTVFEFNSEIAEASLSAIDARDISKIYNIYTLDEICSEFKNIDIEKVFENSGLKTKDKFLVIDVSSMKKLAELLDDKNLETIKTFLKYNLLGTYGEYLSDDFTDAENKYGSAVEGTQGTIADDIQAAGVVNDMLPSYVGERYAEKYVDDETKAKITEMIKGLIEIYRERIKNLDWMSETTKEKAIKKLDTMRVNVGAPEKYDEITLDGKELKSYADGGSLLENIITIQEADSEDNAALEGTKVDKTKWSSPPQTVNATYNSLYNSVTVYAGFLAMPGVYSKDASYESTMGSIGVVIGHEISHAFDKSGSQFDENGNAVNWWTDEDAKAFDERCQAVIDFYDGQEAAPGITTNGELTLTENTADLGGLSVVTELASKTENFDYDEMFRSWANVWMSLIYRERLQRQVMSDSHSPDSVRVNRLFETCDKFFETYGITEGDGMWVAPEDRVSIW